MSARCRRCHRALSNPAAVAAGIGPICAAKESAELFNRAPRPFGVVRAQYLVRRVTPEAVWIEDVGRECISVTNDAEAVVDALAAEYGDRRIIYRDSMGAWDELRHSGRSFTGFAPARDMAPEVLS